MGTPAPHVGVSGPDFHTIPWGTLPLVFWNVTSPPGVTATCIGDHIFDSRPLTVVVPDESAIVGIDANATHSSTKIGR